MISIIIPSLNDEVAVQNLVDCCLDEQDWKFVEEILIIESGIDEHACIRQREKVRIVKSNIARRSFQMNLGAGIAKSECLLFLHADSIPPKNFATQILHTIANGFLAGCFRLQFNSRSQFLKCNAWFTRFNCTWFRFGDQGLFVDKKLFKSIEGYDETKTLLEDQEIVTRIRMVARFKVIPNKMLTSVRKYEVNGIYKTQGTFLAIWLLYKLGFRQEALLRIFKTLK